jgi:shikimate kinase
LYFGYLPVAARIAASPYSVRVNVLLIGMRGSGKTTIGRMVAAGLSSGFVDLDDATIKELAAATVAEAWRVHGEGAFRAAEVRALAAALRIHPGVLSLGGGTPMAAGAAEIIKRAQVAGARVVYLRAPAATLRARLEGKMGNRPSLTGADPLAEIDAVLAKRDPGYLAIADLVVNTDGKSEGAVAAEIVAAVTSN